MNLFPVLSQSNPLFEQARTAVRQTNVILAVLLPPIVIIVALLAGSGVSRAIGAGIADTQSPLTACLLQNLHYILPFGLAILFLCSWVVLVEKRRLSTLGLKPGNGFKKYITGAIVAAVMYALVMGLLVISGNVSVSLNAGTGIVAFAGIVLALAGFVVQGAAEEFIFRGWQMPVIGARYGLLAGIAVSGITFGLMHVIADVSLLVVFILMIFGVFLSLYALVEGGILGVCGFHAVWNWLDGNVFVLNGNGESASLTVFNVQSTGQYVDVINAIVLLAGLVALLVVARKLIKAKNTVAGLASADHG